MIISRMAMWPKQRKQQQNNNNDNIFFFKYLMHTSIPFFFLFSFFCVCLCFINISNVLCDLQCVRCVFSSLSSLNPSTSLVWHSVAPASDKTQLNWNKEKKKYTHIKITATTTTTTTMMEEKKKKMKRQTVLPFDTAWIYRLMLLNNNTYIVLFIYIYIHTVHILQHYLAH